MLLGLLAVIATSRLSSDPAMRESLWASAKARIQAVSGALKDAGISIEGGTESVLANMPLAQLNLNCFLTSDNTMKVELETRTGSEELATSLHMSGTFEWGDHVENLSGKGFLSAGAEGIGSEYTYSREDGYKLEVEGDQPLWAMKAQMGDTKKGPFALGPRLGQIKVFIDPFVLARKMISAGPRIGGISTQFDVGEVAAALANAAEPPPGFARERFVVSLSRLVPGTTDLGPLNHIEGFLYDAGANEVSLVGSQQPGLPPIPLDVVRTACRSILLEGRHPFISIDPDWNDFSRPHHARVGGISPDLANSEMIRRMLHADYAMKSLTLGTRVIPGITSLKDSVAKDHSIVSGIAHRFWIRPQNPNWGDVRKCEVGDKLFVAFDCRPEVRSEYMAGVSYRPMESRVAAGEATDRVAASLTSHYTAVEQQAPDAEFGEVRQVLELSEAFTLLANCHPGEVALARLREFAAGPIAAAVVPTEFAPVLLEGVFTNGERYVLAGGVLLDVSAGEPLSAPALASLVPRLTSDGSVRSVGPIDVGDASPCEVSGRAAASQLLRMAEEAARQGDPAAGRALAVRASGLDPAWSSPHRSVALALLGLGKPNKAMEEAKLFRSLEPGKDSDILVVACRLALADAERHPATAGLAEAEQAARELSEKYPADAESRMFWGLAQLRSGSRDAGLASLLRAADLAPPDRLVYSEARSCAAELLLQLGRAQEALALVRAALAVTSRDPQLHLLHGESLRRLGKDDEAVVEFQRAKDIDPKNPLAGINLGELALKRDDSGLAYSEFSDAVQLQPNSARANEGLGAACERLGIWPSAIFNLRKAAADASQTHEHLIELQNRVDADWAKLGHTDEEVSGGDPIIEPRDGAPGFRRVRVQLRIQRDRVQVTASYEFKNGDRPRDVTISFPEQKAHLLANGDLSTGWLSMFKVVSSGAPLKGGIHDLAPGSRLHRFQLHLRRSERLILTQSYEHPVNWYDFGSEFEPLRNRTVWVTGRAVSYFWNEDLGDVPIEISMTAPPIERTRIGAPAMLADEAAFRAVARSTKGALAGPCRTVQLRGGVLRLGNPPSSFVRLWWVDSETSSQVPVSGTSPSN